MNALQRNNVKVEYVHQSIRNSELVIMDAKGHCPHMSEPEEVVKEIRRFLQ